MNTDSHGYRPIFLFGSYTSPLPKIDDITHNILNGDLEFHTNGRLYKEARNTNTNDPIDVVQGFFKKASDSGNGHECTICQTSDEIRSATTQVIVLNEKFEDASKHAEVLRWFAYDSC